jgi:hypothetical protein
MRKFFPLSLALLFVFGCGRETEVENTVLKRLDEVKSQIAAQQSQPPRWVFANKRQIESAIFEYARTRSDTVKKAEKLSPDIEVQIARYEQLEGQLSRLRMEQMRARRGFPVAPYPFGGEAMTNTDYLTLSNQVAEAKMPVADIIDRRAHQYSEFYNEIKVQDLVAEYAKDKYDLVVDSSDEQFSSQSKILFRKSGDATDITEGVIGLLKEKMKR